MFQGVKSATNLARARKMLKPVASARLLSNNRYAFAPALNAGRPAALSHKFQASAAVYARALSTESSKTAQTMEFQAETRKLLDIVTHSIYTDKEVFIRELVSNASDALEKFRYKQSAGDVTSAESIPLEINIYTDSKRKTLTIVDNGIGMTRDELIANLGTIARSGSKAFVENLKGEGATDSKSTTDGIIGQFGVGFYSSFMVSDEVEVASLSASDSTATAHKWQSDGSGQFTIDTLPTEEVSEQLTQHRGSRITMKLKASCEDYADAEKIKSIIKRYSSFVAFPIKVNGEAVNVVQAIWTKEKTAVTEEQYDDFYRFIANTYDKPIFRLHFRADAPIELKCLFYVPRFHSEKFGMGRTEMGVNLYSRKVLIESKPADLLPEWLRFLKGAVDSEDLPLSLSREKAQNTNLVRRIKEVVTRKFLRFLSDEMKNSPETYREFYLEYHMFLKEGVCQDYAFMGSLSKLLLFESSAVENDVISLDDYIARCTPEQKHIYYLVAPNREAALSSPYYETFKKHKIEVLFLYNTIDDFVMNNVKEYGGRTFISAETSSVDLSKEGSLLDKDAEADADKKAEEKKVAAGAASLSDAQAEDICAWLTLTLGGKVKQVKVTKRLSDSPAIVTDHESGALRRMMKMVEQANAGRKQVNDLPAQTLEINPSHPLIVGLYELKDNPNSVASLVAEQLLDNCLMQAGLVEDPRYMIPRLNDLLLATTLHHKNELDYDKKNQA